MKETTPNYGRTIRLFLVDGRPNGLIKAELINWSGVALGAPRAELARLLKRQETRKTGVYILLGPDPDKPLGQKAYIGEADNVSDRLRRHEGAEDLDFFGQVAAIVSKDDNLTKAHARFLESRLISLTREAGSIALANGTAPQFSLLPEADIADMAYFEEQLKIVLPILGFDLFRPSTVSRSPEDAGAGPVFEFQPGEVMARGRETADGFVVLSGSTARRETTQSFPDGYRILRDQLVSEGKLIAVAQDTVFRFTDDVAFSSPSTAASIVAGRSASGPLSWCIPGTGKTYNSWKAELKE